MEFSKITDGLQEINGETTLRDALANGRQLTAYWGTAPTGRVHIGYLVPIFKIIDLIEAGCKVIVLVADLHAVLDSMKSTFEQVAVRSEYYELIISALITRFGGDLTKVTFIRGTSFQLSREYTLDMYRANTLLTVLDTSRAGAEVVKQSDNPIMTGLIYPVLQCLDFEYLKADIFLGGIDQRKISMLAKDLLPKLGYKRKQVHIFNKMVPALSKTKSAETSTAGAKMSASSVDTKIDILDTEKVINKKIGSAYCLEGDTDDNTLLTFAKMVLYPALTRLGLQFTIKRDEKYGGDTSYDTYNELCIAFRDRKLHPMDLKLGVSQCLNVVLAPIREEFQIHSDLLARAY